MRTRRHSLILLQPIAVHCRLRLRCNLPVQVTRTLIYVAACHRSPLVRQRAQLDETRKRPFAVHARSLILEAEPAPKRRSSQDRTQITHSPLARRPYDLRHAAVSLWLNAGVPATEVARRAGHSVAVLLKVYAHCIDGQAGAANQRITDALTPPDDQSTRDDQQS